MEHIDIDDHSFIDRLVVEDSKDLPDQLKKREIIIVGNWKMYKTAKEAVRFLKEFAPLIKNAIAKTYLAVPFTVIEAAAKHVKEDSISIGAQNMHDATEGAFTGEIAAEMLLEAGAKFVVLGHSERRKLFHEDNAFINRKVHRALLAGLQPILCVGETLAQREGGETAELLVSQISEGLTGVTAEQLERIILAYEPVWAIGTHQSATPEMAEEAHQICRNAIAKVWSEESAKKISILYGGSVKPETSLALLREPDIDGLLVGGASLSAENFSKIVNAANDLGLKK